MRIMSNIYSLEGVTSVRLLPTSKAIADGRRSDTELLCTCRLCLEYLAGLDNSDAATLSLFHHTTFLADPDISPSRNVHTSLNCMVSGMKFLSFAANMQIWCDVEHAYRWASIPPPAIPID